MIVSEEIGHIDLEIDGELFQIMQAYLSKVAYSVTIIIGYNYVCGPYTPIIRHTSSKRKKLKTGLKFTLSIVSCKTYKPKHNIYLGIGKGLLFF